MVRCYQECQEGVSERRCVCFSEHEGSKTFCCVTLNKSEGRGVMTDGVVRSEHQHRAPESPFSQVEELQWLIMPPRTAPHLLWTSSFSEFHFYSPRK